MGLLFDLDGVLIDSERRYTQIWARVDEMYPTGVPDFPHVIKGMTLADILNKYFAPEHHQSIIDYCIGEERKLTFGYMPGAVELLRALRDRGVPAAMVTSSDMAKMERLRQVMPDILEWFTAVVYGEMTPKGKPAPDPYLLGAQMIGVDPHRCAVVEDSLQGLRAGRAAGAYLVGMTDTLGRAAIEGNADIVLDSLQELDLDTLIDRLQRR